jgi:hypothetical protein
MGIPSNIYDMTDLTYSCDLSHASHYPETPQIRSTSSSMMSLGTILSP